MSRLSEVERRLMSPPAPGGFSQREITGLPDHVQKYFIASIESATPLASSARLKMRGHIKVGRWLPFTASQVLSPHQGFRWWGRAGGVIVGSDSYLEGEGLMDWKLAGLKTVAHAEGPDVSLSAAGRAGAEAIWVPTALLPRFGVVWQARGPDRISAGYRVGSVDLDLHFQLDGSGLARSIVFERWGDPGNRGSFGWHPFGGQFMEHSTFDGLTIPSRGRLGWHYGTDLWPDGEFFRYRITELETVKNGEGTSGPRGTQLG